MTLLRVKQINGNQGGTAEDQEFVPWKYGEHTDKGWALFYI